MFDYMASFFDIILGIFDVPLPGLPSITFKQVLFGFFAISILLTAFKMLLRIAHGGGVSYRIGRAVKRKDGDGSD